MSYQNLIARLEKATEPDRELDGEIAKELGWCWCEAWILSEDYWLNADGEKAELPRYTASIDAALTLVPEDHYVSIPCLWPGKSNNQVEVVSAAKDIIEGENNNLTTPAIALCNAALKARQSLTSAQGE